ncbi:hypothetical protein FSP39_000049 [Pinctada imbricata]|uniref:Asteroid domain-containing protein n=1 Tax=Pinctada imbricata TaxID=66713 RepID=A0AA89BWJ2_PINIB|nr:hypothetical protein FSP39_000049 [Pinctada imbricata]
MGIRGLTTYMHNQQQFFRNHRLCNTKLVIDGNSIKHFMFNHQTTDFVHGGDYDEIDQQINEFFQKLRMCNISPYVMLDGGFDPDDRKLNTTLRRKREQIRRNRVIARGGSEEIRPIFDNEVLKCRMRKLDIPFIVTEFEADYDMALLANDLDCPVLSRDSDFYVFPVKRGYIHMDYLDCNVKNKTNIRMGIIENYLECQIYYSQDLVCDHFPGLGDDGLSLLATLAGNDYVEPGTYDTIIQKAFNDNRRMKFEEMERLQTGRRLELCIEFLRIPYTIDEALNILFLSHGTNLNQKRAREKFEHYMEFYTLRSGSTPLRVFDFFHPRKSVTATPSDNIRSVDGREMPNWMLDRHRRGRIGNFELDVFVKRRVCLKTPVEETRMQGVFDSTRSIRQITYGIIVKGYPYSSKTTTPTTDHENDEAFNSYCDEEVSQPVTHTTQCWVDREEGDSDNKYSVEEYTREGEKLHRFLVKANLNVNSLSEVPVMSKYARKQVISMALDVDFDLLKPFSDKWRLLIGVLIFWMREGTSVPQIEHAKALISCIAVLSIKENLMKLRDLRFGRKSTRDNYQPYSLDNAISKMSISDLKHIYLSFFSFFRRIDRTKNPTNLSIVHIFQEFQAILKSVMSLNEFLMAPFPSINLTETYRGSFVYSLATELQSRGDQDEFLEEKFQRGSPVQVAVGAIQNAVFSSL